MEPLHSRPRSRKASTGSRSAGRTLDHFRLHLHNGRNMAIASAYAAMRTLGPDDTLELDGTIGGFGGCPYCGNGRATGMAPTEYLLHMMEDMGIETGVDIDKLIDCVWTAERIIGRELYGHVSKAGPRPKTVDQLYDMNAPFIETLEEARHFKKGPEVYEGGIYPYREPITSPYRERVEAGLPGLRLRRRGFPLEAGLVPLQGQVIGRESLPELERRIASIRQRRPPRYHPRFGRAALPLLSIPASTRRHRGIASNRAIISGKKRMYGIYLQSHHPGCSPSLRG